MRRYRPIFGAFNVLKLPRTPAGRDQIRDALKHRNGDWSFPDGSHASEIDWDVLAIEVETSLRDLEISERALEEDLAQFERERARKNRGLT